MNYLGFRYSGVIRAAGQWSTIDEAKRCAFLTLAAEVLLKKEGKFVRSTTGEGSPVVRSTRAGRVVRAARLGKGLQRASVVAALLPHDADVRQQVRALGP